MDSEEVQHIWHLGIYWIYQLGQAKDEEGLSLQITLPGSPLFGNALL